MSDGMSQSCQTPRRWRSRYSVVLGCLLALAFLILNSINNWRSQRQILAMRGLPSGLLLSDADAFERFKQDLAFQYQGRPVFPKVHALHSSLLIEQFPDHFFVQVFPEYKFFGFTLSPSYREERWAISRTGGPNRSFENSINRFGELIDFLSSTKKRIRSVEDAEIVRRIFVELGGAGSFADPSKSPHRKVGPSVWRIAGSPATRGDLPVLSVLEIFLGPDDVVESGWLTSE